MELRTNDEAGANLPEFLCLSEEELGAVSDRNDEDLRAYVKQFVRDQANRKTRTGKEEALLLKSFVANCDTLEQVVLITVNFMEVVRKALNRAKALIAVEDSVSDTLLEALLAAAKQAVEEQKAKEAGTKGNSPNNPN